MATFLDRAVRVDAVVVHGEMDLALKEITVLEDLLVEKYFLRRASATGLTCIDLVLYQRPLRVTHRRSLTVMAGLVPAIHALRVDLARIVDASLRWHDGDAGMTGTIHAQELVSTAGLSPWLTHAEVCRENYQTATGSARRSPLARVGSTGSSRSRSRSATQTRYCSARGVSPWDSGSGSPSKPRGSAVKPRSP